MSIDIDSELKEIMALERKGTPDFEFAVSEDFNVLSKTAHGHVLETLRGWHVSSDWAELVHVNVIRVHGHLAFGYIHSYASHDNGGILHYMRYCKKGMRMLSRRQASEIAALFTLPLHLAKSLVGWRDLTSENRQKLAALIYKHTEYKLEFLR